MSKKNSQERKEKLEKRRIEQRNRMPTQPFQTRGKYVPAGEHKNTKPTNR